MNIDKADTSPAWCGGCGNYALLKALDEAIDQAGIDRRKLVLVSGIGQAAKLPHYTKCNFFNGLHGRAVPAATGIKLANPDLNVVVTSGDGDMYGEGGNHLVHAIRRNVSIKAFVHDNQVYGLTKGQASPTSELGMVTKVQANGVMSLQFNPLALAIVEDAAFVARSFTGNREHLRDMMTQALELKEGFALLDIFQPCPSFNHRNTFKWYKDRVKPVSDSHDPYDRSAALKLALTAGDELPIGVIYRCRRPSFESRLDVLKAGSPALTYGEGMNS